MNGDSVGDRDRERNGVGNWDQSWNTNNGRSVDGNGIHTTEASVAVVGLAPAVGRAGREIAQVRAAAAATAALLELTACASMGRRHEGQQGNNSELHVD